MMLFLPWNAFYKCNRMDGGDGSDESYERLSLRSGSVLKALVYMKVSYRPGTETTNGAALEN